jgi:hypothetical protein
MWITKVKYLPPKKNSGNTKRKLTFLCGEQKGASGEQKRKK